MHFDGYCQYGSLLYQQVYCSHEIPGAAEQYPDAICDVCVDCGDRCQQNEVRQSLTIL